MTLYRGGDTSMEVKTVVLRVWNYSSLCERYYASSLGLGGLLTNFLYFEKSVFITYFEERCIARGYQLVVW